jgi:glutaminyl-tRNA synthetase
VHLPDVHLRPPIEDALECITHSICTLEFEDQRPFYDWLLERLAEGGLLQRPLPQQIEFSRLNLTYVVLSKRKLIQLVEEKHVDGWDDPRMPTLVGARRRGYCRRLPPVHGAHRRLQERR